MKESKTSAALLLAGLLTASLYAEDAKTAAPADKAAAPVAAPAAQQKEAVSASDPKLWEFLPAVVAEVNGKKITRDEIVKFFAAQMPDGKLPPMIQPEMLKMIAPGLVKNYIERPLLLSAAEKAGFKPSDAMVRETFDKQIKEAQKEELEAFKAQLKAQGKTLDSFVAELAANKEAQEQLAIQTYLEKTVADKITVSEADAKKYYDEHLKDFTTPADDPEAVRASHILLAVKKDASKEDIAKAKAEAEKILAQLNKNEIAFEEAAQKYSQCPSGKQNKGSLGAFKKGDMVKEFEEAAFALKDGEVSGIVQSSFGFHIIRRDVKQAAKVQSFEEVKPMLMQGLKGQKSQEAMRALLDKLNKENGVKIFVTSPAVPPMM